MSQKGIEGNLFSSEEMNNIMPNTMQFPEDKPEAIFGMTFKNAEERRAYFREELRKKLPELKKIEGYPIGSDEDILNLSDPPYYTACPNPWLNQFVEEWEKEKTVLEKEGKRSKDFEVKEPYAADVSVGKNSPIYNAHSYHTKVPPKAVSLYLSHYTQQGDIVLDAFSGSGMTGVACNNFHEENKFVECRKVILNDLSPAATNLSYNNTAPIDILKFKKAADEILSKAKEKYGWMFKTKGVALDGEFDVDYYVWSEVSCCENCSAELKFSEIAFTDGFKSLKKNIVCPQCGAIINKRTLHPIIKHKFDKEMGVSVPVPSREIAMICYKVKGKKQYKKVDAYDNQILEKVADLEKSEAPIVKIPDMQMMRVGRMKSSQINYIHQFFFDKTKYILSYMWSLASAISDTRIQSLVKYWLDSQFVNLSYRNRYRPNVSFPYNPMTGVFYIPMMSCESNPFVAYKNKLTKIIDAFRGINLENRGAVVTNSSASELPLRENSVDYIFTDPPFGENIYYSDLNFYIEAWNRVYTSTDSEAIVDKVKNKTVFSYNKLIENCFKEYYRVLKPKKWISIVFSNTSASVWNGIQNALRTVGFIIVNVSSLDKKQGSFQSVNTTTAVKQDLVITCFKPSTELISNINENVGNNLGLQDLVEEILDHLPVHIQKDKKTSTIVERSSKILYDRVVSYYVQSGYPVPLDSVDFQEFMRDNYIKLDGMFFTAVQAAEYEEKKKYAPEVLPMGIIVSDEANGIEWLKNQLRNAPKTYQEIQPEWMQAINGVRKHDILPELKQLLEENFIEMEDGKWRLPNIQDDVDKEALRTKALLREFKIYVEQASKPKGKIKEARVEALRAGFKDCYVRKDFKTIVLVGDRIPQNLRDEDDVLLQFYDIAQNKL